VQRRATGAVSCIRVCSRREQRAHRGDIARGHGQVQEAGAVGEAVRQQRGSPAEKSAAHARTRPVVDVAQVGYADGDVQHRICSSGVGGALVSQQHAGDGSLSLPHRGLQGSDAVSVRDVRVGAESQQCLHGGLIEAVGGQIERSAALRVLCVDLRSRGKEGSRRDHSLLEVESGGEAVQRRASLRIACGGVSAALEQQADDVACDRVGGVVQRCLTGGVDGRWVRACGEQAHGRLYRV